MVGLPDPFLGRSTVHVTREGWVPELKAPPEDRLIERDAPDRLISPGQVAAPLPMEVLDRPIRPDR